MHFLLGILTARSLFTFFAIIFALAFIMITLDIISADEFATIIGLEGPARDDFIEVINKSKGAMCKLLDILSKLLNGIFSWAGVDIAPISADCLANSPIEIPDAAKD
jgi:hypothetical protein